jgi:hypothetical protein
MREREREREGGLAGWLHDWAGWLVRLNYFILFIVWMRNIPLASSSYFIKILTFSFWFKLRYCDKQKP